jgi:glucose-1-phosphate adenylyltransferase
MRDTIAIVLAGGVGSRLNMLVKHRAKPAVPFGGIYRIIDFALSNAMNSGINRVAVLTQYKPLSLMRHIGSGAAWDFTGRTRGIEILPPRTGEKDSDWYKGTADAVRQNLDFIQEHESKNVLILSGDHVYYMDYKDMVKNHRKSGAKVTVAMMPMPWEQTSQFGIGIIDDSNRVIDWEEKPKTARSNLASMGIYVFDTDYLVSSLQATKDEDFGHHILPMTMKDKELNCYRFNGYWRDVGTVQSFFESNMDILDPSKGLNPQAWGTCTNVEYRAPFDRAPANILSGSDVTNSSIARGCVIKGIVENSILSPGVVVEKGARVSNSILMHDVYVNSGTIINNTIIDKKVIIGKNCNIGKGDKSIINSRYPKHLNTGLTMIGKGAVVTDNKNIGTNVVVMPYVGENDWLDIMELNDGMTLGFTE